MGDIEVRGYFSLKEQVGERNSVPSLPGDTVSAVAGRLGLAEQELGLILLNGCQAGLQAPVSAGDRVAFFPAYVPFHRVYGMCVL